MKLFQILSKKPAPSRTSTARSMKSSPSPRNARDHRAPGGIGEDLVGVIKFDSTASPISQPAPPWDPTLAERIQSLPTRIGGATNIAAALRLALKMSRKCPKGCRRRIWLLSDGDANRATNDTIPAAQAIAAARININVVAFGEATGSRLLREVAAQTHRGRFVPVQTIHQMSAALRDQHGIQQRRVHRREVALICVDLSASMTTRDFGGVSRIEGVRDALRSLCDYKTRVWS